MKSCMDCSMEEAALQKAICIWCTQSQTHQISAYTLIEARLAGLRYFLPLSWKMSALVP